MTNIFREISYSDLMATLCLALAILHTFLVKSFQQIARKFPTRSVWANFFHLLGEVEVVFGFWAGIYLILLAIINQSVEQAIAYLQNRNFIEPVFVFIIMTVCATRPILNFAGFLIEGISRLIPLKKPMAFYLVVMVVGPLLGSFITEPAAMTVTALILLERYYKQGLSKKLMYATMGLLFVNVSIGGTLTPFAAPPVLMVAAKWNWDLMFMLKEFGWKGALACTISTAIIAYKYRREILAVKWESKPMKKSEQWGVQIVHLLFLAAIVASAHYMILFVGIFLLFFGFVSVTRAYQSDLKLKESLLVGFFLGGIVVLSGPQKWWIEPLLARLETLQLYFGAIGLTAITDNAALTYLGSQAANLSLATKYALVAGSVVGGGLTVIANAPNPAGYGILNASFDKEGISPIHLFFAALIPTVVAAMCFLFL